MSMAINFYFEKKVSVKQRRLLKTFIKWIFSKEKKQPANITYVFCSDDYLLNINRQFLNHDYFTDIITFDLSEKQKPVSGEIYISVDRVKENAQNFNNSNGEELLRVMFHGILHLIGYQDKTKAQKIQMRKKENYYLKIYRVFVPRETK